MAAHLGLIAGCASLQNGRQYIDHMTGCLRDTARPKPFGPVSHERGRDASLMDIVFEQSEWSVRHICPRFVIALMPKRRGRHLKKGLPALMTFPFSPSSLPTCQPPPPPPPPQPPLLPIPPCAPPPTLLQTSCMRVSEHERLALTQICGASTTILANSSSFSFSPSPPPPPASPPPPLQHPPRPRLLLFQRQEFLITCHAILNN